MPSRKNRRGPVRRSISDASAAAKKTKRNSIFNIFNTNSNTTNTSAVNKKPTNLSEKHAKKVERSKSDVSSRSSSQGSKRDKYRNSIHLNTNNSYNNKTNNYNNSESFLQPVTSTPKKIPLTPITEVNSPSSDVNNRSDYFDGLVEATKANKAKLISRGNIGYTSREDLDLIPSTDNMKSKHSKSLDAMHCSQMPADKPTLTKGAAVDTMIKRLSIERFSPPPVQVIGVGGFSYTNPHNTTTPTSPTTILTTVNPSLVITPTKHKSLSPPLTTLKSDKDIVYAQVVCNDLKNVNGNKIHSKETVHNTIPRKNRHSASPPPNIKTQFQKPISHNNDFVIATASSPIPENGNYRNSVKIIRENYPDNGYGNGRDDIDGNNIGITTYGDEEPIIKPNIRYHIPRYLTTTTITNNNNYNSNNHHDNHNTSNNNNNHQYNHNNNEFNNNNYEMRDTDYNVDISLSNRREILESRIKSRIGGLHTINNDNNNVIINRIQNTSSSPPTTKRYHKYGSNEIVNRYSPERTHLDFIQPTATVSQQQQQKHYQEDYTDNNTLRKKSYHYNKTHDKVDSGIEVDSVIKSNGKKKPSYISRFKIG